MTDHLTAPAWAMSCTARIRPGLTVELTMTSAGQIGCEWFPSPPKRLTAGELAKYRAARNDLIAAWSERTGKSVLVLDV